MMKLPPQRETRRRAAAAASGGAAGVTHGPLFDALRRYRLELARAAGAAPYTIFHDRTIEEIAARKPTSLDALGRVYGIGVIKLEKYGPAVLDIVRRVGDKAAPAGEAGASSGAANQGKPWTPEQDQALRRRWDEGAGVGVLAEELGRGAGGIEARLVRLGLVPDRESARARS
jgi:hypothetical protein